jgi:hypothetical protein
MSSFMEQIIDATHEVVPKAKIMSYKHSVDVLAIVERWFGSHGLKRVFCANWRDAWFFRFCHALGEPDYSSVKSDAIASVNPGNVG